METCQRCQKSCRALRCTRCRRARYCSVQCQKRDWKSGHNMICRPGPPSPQVAEWAMQQLATMAGNLTPQQMKEISDKAVDEVARQEKANKLQLTSKAVQVSRDRVFGNTKSAEEPSPSASPAKPANLDLFSVVIEEMRHISRFQVTLRKKSRTTDLDLMEMQVSIRKIGDSCSIVELKSRDEIIVFSACFPRALTTGGRVQPVDDGTLQITLTYQDDPTIGDLISCTTAMVPTETINLLQCGSCRHRLLPAKSIHRTTELPLGHWDEIADYLICYNGQPVVDFTHSAMAAESTIALQDANVICLNYKDTMESAIVLPVPGYGEEEKKHDKTTVDDLFDGSATVRGDRPWRDVTGGATVACSQCQAPLGFASLESPETFRLLKHRLSIPNDKGTSHRLSSCASFLAREMVRYAEAKAIFTFVVALDMPQMSFAINSFSKCILLRLVSWDSNLATNLDRASGRPKFRRFAKIVFQETYDKRETKIGAWMWGGVDLCCPPAANAMSDYTQTNKSDEEVDDEPPVERKASTVRILLQKAEYMEALQALQEGLSLFTKDVTDATILVKMGSRPKGAKDGEGPGLTAIPLDS